MVALLTPGSANGEIAPAAVDDSLEPSPDVTPVSKKITVTTFMIRFPTLEMLRLKCRSGQRQIHACTHLLGERLDSSCRRQGDEWSMRTSVSYVALIYLHDPDFLRHEQQHLRDINGLLASHMARLESLRFRSASDCRSAAAEARQDITLAVAASAHASSLARSCAPTPEEAPSADRQIAGARNMRLRRR